MKGDYPAHVTNSSYAAGLSPGGSSDEKVTYEEFLAWLDEDTRAEWVDGEVLIMSPVSEEHQNVGGFLFKLISEFAAIYQLGKVFYEPIQMKTGPRLPGRSPPIFSLYRTRI